MAPSTSTTPRKRPHPRSRRRAYLLVGFLAAVVVGPRSVVGFGFSSIRTACLSGVRPAVSGALSTAASAVSLERVDRHQEADWRRRAAARREGREAHAITCKIAPPRKYGSADWFQNILNLPKSRLLFNIKDHLIFNSAFAFFVSLVHLLTPQHIIDDLHVSSIPHTIMSGALGLLLVFRTNAAYNRFWEARKIWGGVVNTCRNLSRLAAVAMGPDSKEWQEMKEYVKVYPFLLKQHLQNTREDEELDFSRLSREQILQLQEDPNPPLLACQAMSEVVAKAFTEGGTGQSEGGRVPDFTSVSYRMEIERGISYLIDALGMCERILTTPVPRGYSRHTSRFMTVYGVTLPVVLVPHTELFTAPVVAAVCWGLFSIEEIAYFIEQPFDPEYRQLDLMAYSKKIASDVERMTVSSSLGRLGSYPKPNLPGGNAFEKTNFLPSEQQRQNQQQPSLAFEDSSSTLNGSSGGPGVKFSTAAENVSTSWGGDRDNDIVA